MSQHIVGVIFCGGCNPTYDRLRKYEEMKMKYPNYLFEFYKEDTVYSKVLILNGCNAACMVDVMEELNAEIISSGKTNPQSIV